ncbi:MAG: class I SAM-dependent methyltransferase [Deltaproteobacteria bacterium]|nr:class I SAM-dependent methyltransferase [Deltaproteobacteria bacterium]
MRVQGLARRLRWLNTYQLVPPVDMLFDGATTQEEFRRVGEGFTHHFLIGHARLSPGDRVLDIGCGIGQKARPLTKYLSGSGGYDGIDVVPQAIEWCSRSYKRFKNFRFALADIFSSHYNAGGRYRACDYRFPYESETFDLIFLSSVFTHMLPLDMGNYFSEIGRMLKTGGKSVITFFLLSEESLRRIDAGLNTIKVPFIYECDDEICRIADQKTPETTVAHAESYVRKLYDKNHLSITEITYGSWCGRKEFLGCLQDVIIAVKQ